MPDFDFKENERNHEEDEQDAQDLREDPGKDYARMAKELFDKLYPTQMNRHEKHEILEDLCREIVESANFHAFRMVLEHLDGDLTKMPCGLYREVIKSLDAALDRFIKEFVDSLSPFLTWNDFPETISDFVSLMQKGQAKGHDE